MTTDATPPTRASCPTCGSELPVFEHGAIAIMHGTFPDDLPTVARLAVGGAQFALCETCDDLTAVDSVIGLCIVPPAGAAFAYVPAALARRYPEVRGMVDRQTAALTGKRSDLGV